MSREIYTNNATTTLGSSVSPSATTITVAVGTGAAFPSPGAGEYFTATLWAVGSTTGTPNEIVRVTNRTGDSMTVVRGQEGTSATTWAIGDTFANYPTAAWFNGAATSGDVQLQQGNSAVDTGSANAGVITLSPAIASLSDILYAPIRILKANNTNTGTYTLNVNGIGAQNVTIGNVVLSQGQLLASHMFEVVWNGTNFDLISTPTRIGTGLYGDQSVTNPKLAAVPAATLKGNISSGPTPPSDIPISTLIGLLAPVGMVSAFATPAAPDGWLVCDGSAVSRTTYAALFATIGGYWGDGDGSTTFNLPDLRGEFARGWDNGRGIDPGRTFASNQTSQSPEHYHAVGQFNATSNDDCFFITRDWTGSFNSRWVAGAGDRVEVKTITGPSALNVATGNNLNTSGSETRPVNVAVQYCVKY